ncbi:MAG: glycine dehydrogenase (aminomethyl-transferring) [Runella slithyformis]|nr:MAG: glycine dehydrogenase (aminomethyl-transferring) [Runella slithyformis]TAE99302.1 MAG: glycine dehydrogenase (aminomethyl-transferring) [Runella slithyformis]TAF28207.1 MAG: glycine dehydrogenase (aminomethyl-transferring) [Runella slithyformis]TAF46855.1 MAG: glycine dehydrogenase (aminomethyl-transferring) [Runella slithyformis]TAF81828.1 MAG: glycine dehydrogenase (aminomethyl-transferring) [Runella slithyformis]
MKINLLQQEAFESRHHGKSTQELASMLHTVGADSLDQLIEQTVPAAIRLPQPLRLPAPQSEAAFLSSFKKLAQQNRIFKSYIGTGYYDTTTPNVILRNILENPGWYTAYTPYQAEIAQGRLEMLLNFQTLVIDLTGMEIANASLLDEATAAAEAMTMLHSMRPSAKKKAETFFVSELCHPQTIDLIYTRATPLNINVLVGDHRQVDLTDPAIFGALLQYPATDGSVFDYTDLIAAAHEQNVFVAVATDLLSLTLLTPPGEMGADVVVGSAQRFGVPMGFGGPHAAFFATKDAFKRQIPGRIIGVSIDVQGNRALRMALQTREQHIRREKATSNICTAQVLLSVMAGAYAIYHGPTGLKNIAARTHGLTQLFAENIKQMDYEVLTETYFDTITVRVPNLKKLKELAEEEQVNLRYVSANTVGVSFDETKTYTDLLQLLQIFANANAFAGELTLSKDIEIGYTGRLNRQSDFMTHPVFSSYHTEHEMLRYLKSLENKDLSLAHSMIALGSCTMKLNATAEMIPVTWPEFGKMHPFAPMEQTAGYQQLFHDLNEWLCEITGFAAMSLQPNSGAQGEYAGLMTIRAYHESRGDSHRNIALIPSSAHGTNPASAVMAGMKVVVTKCDERGNIDLEDLRAKAEQYSNELSCLMVTYPSTHGVFEESIKEICALIHQHGGQVYMDGANMNAQVGLTSPAAIGADVCHLNLHKTFCIPHGGGGPGMGPIGVASQLVPFLPRHVNLTLSPSPLEGEGSNLTLSPSPLEGEGSRRQGEVYGAVSAAPYGSASILTISYAYIAMMGGEGVTNATKIAILNANYIKHRLEGHYEVLYTGSNGRSAHEMILDCRPFKAVGVEAEDLAKRLMDYGFHAPTLSFPVAGTLMIEPTESESQVELDRFCDAMIGIRNEIREIEEGVASQTDNVLKHAPHTANVIIDTEWSRPYSREKAAFPMPYVRNGKFWPTVSRIDSAFGDRNLVCSCLPVEEYAQNEALLENAQ